MLEQIREKLEALDRAVFYGKAPENIEKGWNYSVFFRVKDAISATKQGKSAYFLIAIVRENYIPEGLCEEFQKKLKEIPGLKIVGDVNYDYTMKPNTGMVVEAATFQVVKARKEL